MSSMEPLRVMFLSLFFFSYLDVVNMIYSLDITHVTPPDEKRPGEEHVLGHVSAFSSPPSTTLPLFHPSHPLHIMCFTWITAKEPASAQPGGTSASIFHSWSPSSVLTSSAHTPLVAMEISDDQ